MDRRKFSVLVVSVLALVALFWGVDQGLAVTGPTPGVNYNVANYANSPLPKGPVATITVTNGGRGYSSSPLPVVTITDFFGVGTNATATATVTAGKVTSIAITNGGANYIAPLVTITGGSGSGAAAWAAIGGSGVSGGMRKFVDKLPGLGPANANLLGQYIPVASPGTLPGFPNDDYYEIALVEYREQMHSDLPPVVGGKTNPAATGGTKLRGYVQEVNGVAVGEPHYLGPLIIATVGKPVRIKFTNRLPVGAAGNLFVPVDVTVMGAGEGPLFPNGNPCDPATQACASYTQNRAIVHLHGGNTPWISDGTAHQWITPAGETTPFPKGASQQNVPDMPLPPSGSATFYYTNQQASRLMFYHEHAYGITGAGVYAGIAAGYLLVDPAGTGEWTLPIPGLADTIPLIIQDKTFVPGPTQLAATDPLWSTTNWGGLGSLWYPHVYMPNQWPGNPDLSGSSPMGRWDYGPWFWPIFPSPSAPPPLVSHVPESFMDTPVINGTAYPYLVVDPKAYRFRILNAANDRFWNLSLFLADPAISVPIAGRTEVMMVPFNSSQNLITPFPEWWYSGDNPFSLDDRGGGVPDPTKRGPAMIQIGTEGGLLPQPAVILNQPINYDYDRRSVTVLSVLQHALFLGPAERADVIIDFTPFAGQTLILYNDSPAPVPAGDPRIDYYTGDPDQITSGGAPSTVPGYGPNTRTLMQIRVNGSPGTPLPDYYNPTTLALLQSTLPVAYAATQERPIVAESAYNAAFGTSWVDQYALISTGSLLNPTFNFTDGSGASVSMVPLSKAIQELFDDYGRMNATLGVELPFTSAFTQTTIPLGFIDPPTEIFKNGETQLWKITHNGVDTHPIHFHLFNVQVINRVGWDGMIKPPDPNELGWKETVRMNPLEDIIVAMKAKTQNIPFAVPNSVRPYNVAMPLGSTVGFAGIDPATGNPIPVVNQMYDFGWEYTWHCHILGHEENDMMRPLVLKVDNPLPPTNLVGVSGATGIDLTWAYAQGPTLATGFQVQRATGGGAFATLPAAANLPVTQLAFIDTTAVAGTAYRYQVVAFTGSVLSTPSNIVTATFLPPLPLAATNLVGVSGATGINLTWAYTQGPTPATGFKVQRATGAGAFATLLAATNLPVTQLTFVDTTAVLGTTYRYQVVAFTGAVLAPPSNIITVTFVVPPLAPATNLVAASVPTGISLSWNYVQGFPPATGFRVQRTSGKFFSTLPAAGNLPVTQLTFIDTTAVLGTTYRYQVIAFSGAVVAAPSNIVTATLGAAPLAATNLVGVSGTTGVNLTWAYTQGSTPATGLQVQRATGAGAFATLPAAANLPVTQLSFIDTTAVLGTTYRYQIVAFSGTMLAAPSNIVTVPFVGPTPLAATNLAGVSGATGINLTWAYTQGPTPATGFQVQRATGAGAFATLPAAANLPLTPLSFIDTTAVVGTSYRYQVVAFNGAVLAPPSNIVTVTFIGAAPLAATNLVATNGVNGVALSWNYVQGSTPATGFMVQRATTKGFTTLLAATNLPVTQLAFVDTTAVVGTTYRYQVVAFNGAILAPPSNIVTIKR